MGGLWSLLTVLGPILILIVLGYVLWRNKQETRPGDEAHSDRAAKALRDALDKEDKQREAASEPPQA